MKEDYTIRDRLKLLQKYIYDELLLLKTKIHETNDTKRDRVHDPKSYKLIKHQRSNKKCRYLKRTLCPAGLYRKNIKHA